jgi:hypothetical protein
MFAVLARLVWRCWRDYGETSFTLRALKDEIGWRQSEETLRQVLHALDDAGWITATSPVSGSRRPWLVRLNNAKLQPQAARALEVNSNAGRSPSPAKPLATTDSLRCEPATPFPPTEQNREDKREDQKQSGLTSSISDGWIGPGFSAALEISRLLAALPEADDGTERVLQSFNLPAAAYAAALEEIKRKNHVRNKTRYAVSLLKTWRAAGDYEELRRRW